MTSAVMDDARVDSASANSVDPARKPWRRTLRRVALAVLAVALVAGGYGAYRLLRMWGYFVPRASVGTLPLIEVPAKRDVPGDVMVVLLSADGGWARLDEELAGHLAKAGYPVVGWNSMRYYMTPRDPDVAADDLTAVMRTYQRKWNRPRVLLIGYSFGADVLPIVVDRLERGDRAHVAGVVLLGFWADAEFKFRPREWLGVRARSVREYPTLPYARRLRDLPILCIGGDHDPRSVCSRIGTPNVTTRTIDSGHPLGAHVGEIFTLMQPMLRKIGD